MMEIGLYTFVETIGADGDVRAVDARERVRRLVEEIELADKVGLDVFGVGEHHRIEYVSSAPAVLLAGASRTTKRIRLTSAVSVLSSDDPVRVFQDFATLDLLSNGRAEIMAGRGSFIESFPLFGYDLDEYDALFSDKLDLLLKIRESDRVTWSGAGRAPINDLPVYPRSVQNPIPVWIAVGGTARSVVRAANYGLPLALGIIGGRPAAFVPHVELYRESASRAGHDPAILPVSINSHGLIADQPKQAADLAFPAYKATMDKIGRERGWPPLTRAQFDASRTLEGANFVGSPDEVVDKILYQHELFGHRRFLMQMTVGSLPHADVLRSIELLGTKVAPAVKRALAQS
jgi:probable LLM family oxidoreductase